MKPFFSIGVTTYNRHDLLKECLASILRQTFTDFEVWVGNDRADDPLSAEMLGIKDDSRLRFVNHPVNLGEMANCNSLLTMSGGRYFTWLADDDMYAPTFLQSIHSALASHAFPQCVFTSYAQGSGYESISSAGEGRIRVLDGRIFLRMYLSRKLKTMGCYGVFDPQYLRDIGGMVKLGKGNLSPYSDNLLAINAGLLPKILYIDAPLVFWRVHSGCRSATSTDLDAFSSAQADFLSRSCAVLADEQLRPDFRRNLLNLLLWCIRDYFTVAWRAKRCSFRDLTNHISQLLSLLRLLLAVPRRSPEDRPNL